MRAEHAEVSNWANVGPSNNSLEAPTGNQIRINQISVAGIFWVTTAIALVLGYSASLGKAAMFQAVSYAGFVAVSGAVIGWLRRDWPNAYFWSGLYAMLAYLAVAGGKLPAPAVGFGWGLVGAVVGGVVGIRIPAGMFSGTICAAILGWLAMFIVVAAMREPLTGSVAFDAYTAAAVGGLLKPFTALLQWFEKQSHQSRFVMASWLAISVLIGNWLVPILAGVQR
jgi:hypothetical protein